MEIVRLILLLLHVLGFAALIGGLLVQLREPVKRVNSLMRDGSGTAVVAGILLVGVIEMGDFHTPDSFNAKVGVKLLIGVVILALVMANVRKERISNALFWLISALTLANVVVALFWAPAHGSY
jgi:cell division protein FtsW (lipid II flippase)